MLQATKHKENSTPSTQTRTTTPNEKTEPRMFSIIRRTLKDKGVPKQARELILKSWRSSTKQQYNGYISKWFEFCGQQINPIKPSINEILKFLSSLYVKGLQYRSLGTARSAISTFLKTCSNIDINKYEEITRFMKGVFIERPALPRYTSTWSVEDVLKYMSKTPAKTLLQLSCKLSVLFLLLSAQRCQTLHLVEIPDIKITNDKVFIAPNHILKQSKPGKHLDLIEFKAFTKDKQLCIVNILSLYIDRTKNLRNSDKLLISTIKPHGPVSKQTVSRWVKILLQKAGVDLLFKPHSIRAAAASKAKLSGIPLETIMKTAGWSSRSVFAEFYNKPISEEPKMLQDGVLDSN